MHKSVSTKPEQTYTWQSFDTSPYSVPPAPPLRGDNDFRPIFFQLGAVDKARGSSYLEWGDNKLLCSVFGPRESTLRRDEFSIRGRVVCEVNFCPFALRSSTHPRLLLAQDKERLSSQLVSCLENSVCMDKYPKSQIEVSLLLIQADSWDIAPAAVVSASLALVDARIELWDLTLACSCMVRSERSVKMDPGWADIAGAKYAGLITLFYQPSLNIVSGVECEGELSQQELSKGVDSCIEGCVHMHKFVENKLKENIVLLRSDSKDVT